MWEILAQPLPAAPPVAPVNPKSPASPAFGYGFYQGPLFQRASQSYVALNEAQQLLAAAQTAAVTSRRGNGSPFGRMRSMSSSGQGVTPSLDPQTIKDHALIYLSVIALQEKQAEELLKEFQAKFDEWHWSLGERIMAYSLIQAREPLLAAIEEQAKSGTPDKDLDGFCFMACEPFKAVGQGMAQDDPIRASGPRRRKICSARDWKRTRNSRAWWR